MTPGESARSWTILGGLHLDLVGDVAAAWFDGSADSQYWTDWSLQAGGVGGNLARHMSEVGATFRLLGVVGTDGLAATLVQQFAVSLVGAPTTPLPVPEAATGIVSVLHLDTGAGRSRRLIGPRRSAVDLISPGQALSALRGERRKSADLLLDGYLLRGRHAQWIEPLGELRSAGWRIHLELVPHDSWQQLDLPTAVRLLGCCASVSSSMGTLERLLALEPDPALAPATRAHRLIERASAGGLAQHALVHARFGMKEAEYSLRMGGGEDPRLRRYDPGLIFQQGKSTQDRIFVHELTGSSARLGPADLPLPGF